ncbi:hypothetical protein [Sphingomonas brevis]|uniref:hypothetical protein n=1 Tax=Sphingomonas brevis TaxID=2908206 RepID=UPI0032AE9971
MMKIRKIGRLFVIKTRLEAYLVTYAIAVGSVERGVHYLQQYPGNGGWLLAAACLGVPFVAGAKLLDSVRPITAGSVAELKLAPRHSTRGINRNRPRHPRSVHGSALPSSHHTD